MHPLGLEQFPEASGVIPHTFRMYYYMPVTSAIETYRGSACSHHTADPFRFPLLGAPKTFRFASLSILSENYVPARLLPGESTSTIVDRRIGWFAYLAAVGFRSFDPHSFIWNRQDMHIYYTYINGI